MATVCLYAALTVPGASVWNGICGYGFTVISIVALFLLSAAEIAVMVTCWGLVRLFEGAL